MMQSKLGKLKKQFDFFATLYYLVCPMVFLALVLPDSFRQLSLVIHGAVSLLLMFLMYFLVYIRLQHRRPILQLLREYIQLKREN